MATFPEQVLEQITEAKDYLSELNKLRIDDLQHGCEDCSPKDYKCLTRLIKAIDFKVEYDNYDEDAFGLYEQIVGIVGGEVFTPVAPQVSAGADRTAGINIPQVFTATITPGTASIVSILWEQTSGTPATLSGQTTSTLTVSGFSLGDSTFKVTVTDADDLTASDSVTLTGIPQTEAVAYWGSKMDGTVLTYAQILAQGTSFDYVIGADITIPITVLDAERWWFAIPENESIKNWYEDTINVLNKGEIGTDQDLINAPTLVVGDTNLNFYQNVYPVPQPNPLIVKTI